MGEGQWDDPEDGRRKRQGTVGPKCGERRGREWPTGQSVKEDGRDIKGLQHLAHLQAEIRFAA